MARGEPTLAPEWLKAAAESSSSHSDEHNTGTSSRIRLPISACDNDAPRASLSSFRRSASITGSTGHDRDSSSNSRAYSSFGRSRRDRDRDRAKDILLDNGYFEYADSLMTRRIEKDTLRRSNSMVPRRSESDSNNGVLSLSKVSFERDFPSLGAEEKQGGSDVARVSSLGISTAINSPRISTSAVVGGDGWTSALAEVPVVRVGNEHSKSFTLQTTANTPATSSSTATGLSMAETLAHAPSRARTAPPLSNENERRKELTLMQQYNKLIPVCTSSEKSKPKGARNGDVVSLKIVQQPSSLRPPATKPDILKNSQAGNFLVLNREKINGTSPTIKDGPPPQTTPSKGSSSQMKSIANPKPKVNGIGGEKKPPFQAQDRNDFFNSLRKKAEMKNGASSSSSVKKSDEKIMGEEGIAVVSSSGFEPSVADNGNGDACDEEPETFVALDEEEKAFLESLGWNENAGEGALTAEEIESFVKKHEEKLGPDFKYKAGLPDPRRNGSSSSGLSPSSSEAEI